MADQPARLEAATVRAEVGSNILYRFSNDPVGAEQIPTLSGPLNNLKQVSAEIRQEGSDAVSSAVAEGVVDLNSAVASASDSANSSMSAANMAASFSNPFANIADGLANTSGSGAANRFFSIPGSGGNLSVAYRNDSGVAVKIGEAPSNEAIKEIEKNFSHISDSYGIAFGVLDESNALGMDLSRDGKLNLGDFKDVAGRIKSVEDRSFREIKDRSGHKLSILDQGNAIAMAIEDDGTPIFKGRNILKELDEMKSGAANSKWITPSKDLITWGDSMSENTWQKFLRELMPDRSIVSGGVGGQKSGQIVRRQGGLAPMITIAGNAIPASGSIAVSVDVPFMYNAQVVYGRLYGVNGTLSYVNGTLTFTRSIPGVQVKIDDVTPFILSQEEGYDFRTATFWMGNNDYQPEFRPQIDGNVLAAVNFLKPQDERFFVLGIAIADYSDRLKGTQYYSDIMALHEKWRSRWPNNFVDVTQLLQMHYDPNNPTDVQNLIDGCTPSSLRVDNIHLNDAGWRIVANHIYELIKQRGW